MGYSWAMNTGVQPGDLQLKPPGDRGSALTRPVEGQGRLQGEAIEGGEIRVRQPALHQDSLGQTGAVPNDDKADLAAGAQVRDPTLEGHHLAHVLAQAVDEAMLRGAVWHRGHRILTE